MGLAGQACPEPVEAVCARAVPDSVVHTAAAKVTTTVTTTVTTGAMKRMAISSRIMMLFLSAVSSVAAAHQAVERVMRTSDRSILGAS
jgi:hypothetical protein